jgi:hypothetical protein
MNLVPKLGLGERPFLFSRLEDDIGLAPQIGYTGKEGYRTPNLRELRSLQARIGQAGHRIAVENLHQISHRINIH